MLDLVPSLSFTTLEVSNINITLVVVNVTSTDFISRSVVNGLIGVNSVVIGINVFLLKLEKSFVRTILVDVNELSESLHEGLLLDQREVFLVLDLLGEEIDELEGNLIVLKTFNVVIVLGTSSGE